MEIPTWQEALQAVQGNLIIGIDPGLTGALVVLGEQKRVLYARRLPVIGSKRKQLDERHLCNILDTIREVDLAVIERAQPMPKVMRGVTSAFRSGEVYGRLCGILCGVGLRYQAVPPRTWQAQMLAGEPHKGREECKASSKVVALRLFPELSRIAKRKADEGMFDAALIAAYGWRLQGSRVP